MLRKTLIAAAAAAMFGSIASFATVAPAQAVPLTHALQSKAQADLSMVSEVGWKKKRWRKRHSGGYHKRRYGGHKRYRHRGHRPGVSFSLGFAPGFYYGSGYHPRFRVRAGAPYHCHKWRDRFGHRQRTCHRHH